MQFTKTTGGGGWVDKASIREGDIGKLVTEAQEVEGQNGKQIVAKIQIKGSKEEPKNVSINNPSKNALIEAFGSDSQAWMNAHLTLHTEKTVIAGKRGIALYLVPEGFEVTEDAGGYIVVVKKGSQGTTAPKKTIDYPEEAINSDSIPF